MSKIKCIFVDTLTVPCKTPEGDILSEKNTLLYPEKDLSIKGQQSFNIEDYMSKKYIVTNSPFIVSCFKSSNVYIYNIPQKTYSSPTIETYGASFDTMLTGLFELEVLIAENPLKEIKEILLDYDEKKLSPEEALKKLDKFGNSFELNYRRNQIKIKID